MRRRARTASPVADLAGLAFAYATKPFTSPTGTPLLSARANWKLPSRVIGARSFSGSKLSSLVDERDEGRGHDRRRQDGVAVRLGVRNRFSRDPSAGAGAVVDDDGMVGGVDAARDDPREDIEAAAGGKADDDPQPLGCGGLLCRGNEQQGGNQSENEPSNGAGPMVAVRESVFCMVASRCCSGCEYAGKASIGPVAPRDSSGSKSSMIVCRGNLRSRIGIPGCRAHPTRSSSACRNASCTSTSKAASSPS